MKEKTKTWPTGLSGMMRMMVVGMRVKRSLPVLLTAFTSLKGYVLNVDFNDEMKGWIRVGRGKIRGAYECSIEANDTRMIVRKIICTSEMLMYCHVHGNTKIQKMMGNF